MTRIYSTLYWSVIQQARNGFYFATLFVALIWLALLLPLAAVAGPAQPLLIVGFAALNPTITCFYFVGALVLLAKGEGSLGALAVTPLRPGEYLAVQALLLATLATLETLVILVPVFGPGFGPTLVVGLLLLGALYTLIGYAAAVRYDSLNAYLLPSMLVVVLLLLPLLELIGLLSSPLFWLHPAQPALFLLRSGVEPVAVWQVTLAAVLAVVWLVPAYLLARWAHRKAMLR
jgi:fluoroquinolone transport system permease protein